MPRSSRYKVIVLRPVFPFSVGRVYSGHTGISVALLPLSLVVIGVDRAWIDAVVLLCGHPTDPIGWPLPP